MWALRAYKCRFQRQSSNFAPNSWLGSWRTPGNTHLPSRISAISGGDIEIPTVSHFSSFHIWWFSRPAADGFWEQSSQKSLIFRQNPCCSIISRFCLVGYVWCSGKRREREYYQRELEETGDKYRPTVWGIINQLASSSSSTSFSLPCHFFRSDATTVRIGKKWHTCQVHKSQILESGKILGLWVVFLSTKSLWCHVLADIFRVS